MPVTSRLVAAAALLLAAGGANAQSEPTAAAPKLYTFQLPQLPEGGGQMGLVRAIQLRVKYPMRALRYGLQGQGQVSFVVTPEGKVTHIKIKRSINEDLDGAIVAAVQQLPLLQPATQRGKPVACILTAPVTFALDSKLPLARGKKPVPAADSLQLVAAVEQLPLYHDQLGYQSLAADLAAEYLKLGGEAGCFIPKTNLGVLLTIGPGGTIYHVKQLKPNPQEYEELRAEFGDAVPTDEEPDLPAACEALLAQAARQLPRLSPAYANGRRVAIELQLTLLAPAP
jgi:TonB family protein